MAIMLDEKQAALGLGCFFATVHAVWVALVATGSAAGLLNWIMDLHMLSMPISVTAFNLMTAVTLIVVTFVVGAVFGWIFAKVWNWAGKQKHL
jgi:hypothetical protein